jgi:hypothetical protein
LKFRLLPHMAYHVLAALRMKFCPISGKPIELLLLATTPVFGSTKIPKHDLVSRLHYLDAIGQASGMMPAKVAAQVSLAAGARMQGVTPTAAVEQSKPVDEQAADVAYQAYRVELRQSKMAIIGYFKTMENSSHDMVADVMKLFQLLEPITDS